MVSELLQDRPRLVKQMGSVIFILVYKRIFKFPLGYLNYHQRCAFLKSPSSQNYIPEKLFPREAAVISSSLVLLYLWWNSARSQQGLAQCYMPLEVFLVPDTARGVRSPVLSRPPCRALSNAERAAAGSCVRAAGLPGLLSSSLLSTAFVPYICPLRLSLTLIHKAGRIWTAGAQLSGRVDVGG